MLCGSEAIGDVGPATTIRPTRTRGVVESGVCFIYLNRQRCAMRRRNAKRGKPKRPES
jgi:hypothetical protein